MLGMTSTYNPQEHTIVGGEIGPFVERLVEHDSKRRGKLFVVRYNKLETFVVCEWLVKPFDVFVDVLNIGKSLSNFTHEKATELRRRLFAPVTAQATSTAIAQAESDYLHDMQDWNEEEGERLAKCAIGE